MDVHCDCKHAPWGIRTYVECALRWIPAEHLSGIARILLTDTLPPIERDTPDGRHARDHGYETRGWYCPAESGVSAYIALHVPDIFRTIPKVYRVTPVPTIKIAHTVAHEVAHHLARTRGFVSRDSEKRGRGEREEAKANEYADAVLENMCKRWYYRFGYGLIKDLANYHYAAASLFWKKGDYRKAAGHWYDAWCLNSTLADAFYWHNRAKEMESQSGVNPKTETAK
jgi:hypothetical protein